MVGKARIFSDAARETVYQKEFDDEIYTAANQQNSYNLGSVHFSDNSGIANITQAGTDQRKANLKGALFTGNIGFDLQTAVLDVGSDTINLLEDASSTALSVVSTDRIITISAGNTADLTTILGAQRPGQRLILYGISGNTITIKHTASATANTILCPNAVDFVLLNTDVVQLVYDITTTKWRIIGGSIGGGGGSGYDTIEDEAIALTQRTTMNFTGAGVTAVDNAIDGRTDITISGSASPLTTKGDIFGFDTGDNRIPVGADGQVLTADSGDALGVSWQAGGSFSGNLSDLVIDTDKSWLDFDISDLGSLGSNAAIVPGAGFIRMGTAEEIRMKNPAGDNDLIITSGNNSLSNQSIIFRVSSGNQLTISEFDIDIVQNDIINTRDITPAGSGGSTVVGSTGNFYNQMHAQFFIPEAATVILQRYGLSKTGNTLYVNFDDTNADAGFSIYEEGFESFRFYHPTSTVNSLHIGSSAVFTAGEEYRIQMGENSTASARIFFIEGVGNDLILDRAGAGTDQGVQIRGAGLSIARFLSDEIKIFQPLNANTLDLFNVVDIKSNGGGGATTGTIGELITNDGGFDYFMRSRLTWESDADTYIEFTGSAISIVSDDAMLFDIGSGNTYSFGEASTPILIMSTTAAVFQSGVLVSINDDLIMNGNDILMSTGGNIAAGGAGEGMTNIGHLDFIDNQATPAASVSLYSDGTDLFANTGGTVVNITNVSDGIFLDSTFRIQGSVDQTKQMAFEVDGFTTATTRTFTMPDASGTVFLASAVQNLLMNANNIVMGNGGITGIEALTFTDIGGFIDVSDTTSGFNFITTSNRPFRFTPNTTNVLDIDDNGITMLGTSDIDLSGNEIIGVDILRGEDDTTFQYLSAVASIDGTYTDASWVMGITNAGAFQIVKPSGPPITLFSVGFDAVLVDLPTNFFDNQVQSSYVPTIDSDLCNKLYVDSAGGGANTALSNLASVAINTSLISDTDNTDDLGSPGLQWKDLYVNGTGFIDAITLNTGATITIFDIDETLAANSDTRVPTQQAVKAYVDNNSAGGTGYKAYDDTNEFWHTLSVISGDITNDFATTDDVVYYVLYVPTKDISVSRFGFIGNSTGSGAGTAYIGVYDVDAATYEPDTLLEDGQVSFGIGFREAGISPVNLTAGTPYFFAIKIAATSGTPNTNFYLGWQLTPMPMIDTYLDQDSPRNSAYGWFNTYSITGLPTNPSSLTRRRGNLNVPAIFFRVT